MLRRSNVAPVAALAMLPIAACSSSSPAAQAKSPSPKPSASPATGSITIVGTPGDLRLVAAAKAPFQAANPKARVQASVSALGGELAAVLGGSVSAGLTDYPRSAVTGLANADKLVDPEVAANSLIFTPYPTHPLATP